MDEWNAFLAWRRGSAPLTTERAFVLMLNGNLGAAHMLSRLLDLAAGRPGPQPVQWQHKPWWPLPWSWWAEELGVPERTGRRHAATLAKHGLVQTRVLSNRGLGSFVGSTLFWTVCPEVVVRQWSIWTKVQTGQSGQSGLSWGKPQK